MRYNGCMPNQSNNLIYLKLFMMAAFWGGTFIAGRMLAGVVPPWSAAFLRFAIASFVLMILLRIDHGGFPPVKRDQWRSLILLSLSGILAYNAFFFSGLERVEAGRAAVIIANNPISIALFSALIFKDKLTPLKLTGILISISGAIIVITRGAPLSIFSSGIGMGELLIFCCVISWTTYSLLGRSAMAGFTPLSAVSYSSLLGTILLFPMACSAGLLQNIGSIPLPAWAALGYLALFGTVLSFVWYYQGIKAIGSIRAGQFINFVPVSAVLLSALILNEPLTVSLLLGLALVSSGVYLSNRRQ